MDILSHILITNLAFKELPIEQRGLAIFLGVLPDLISFCPVLNFDFLKKLLFFKKIPHSYFPKKVFLIYKITHSLVIWLIIELLLYIFGINWLAIIGLSWGLHIVLDIFTHNSNNAMSTMVFWPIFDVKLPGIVWSNKWFLLVNYLIIGLFYYIFN